LNTPADLTVLTKEISSRSYAISSSSTRARSRGRHRPPGQPSHPLGR
jgi:hypothetical protein